MLAATLPARLGRLFSLPNQIPTHTPARKHQLMSLPTSDPDISPLTDQLPGQTTREH